MGICNSCESTAVATAKLVSLDGGLEEFSTPVKVSQALKKSPKCFVCNSDEMEFNDLLSPVDVDEFLQVGQLYFALPLSWLKRPLLPEDMVSLAVKASLAIGRSTTSTGGGRGKCGWCNITSVDPLVFYGEKRVKSRRKVVVGTGGDCGSGLMVEETRGRRRGGAFKLTKKLSTIQEDS